MFGQLIEAIEHGIQDRLGMKRLGELQPEFAGYLSDNADDSE